MARCAFGMRSVAAVSKFNLQRHGNNLGLSGKMVSSVLDHEDAIAKYFSEQGSDSDSKTSDAGRNKTHGGDDRKVSYGHILYALTLAKTASAARSFPIWLSTARLTGSAVGAHFYSRQVASHLLKILGRRTWVETSVLLQSSTCIGFAQDARASEVVLRGKGVIWTLPPLFTRTGSRLPDGTHCS